MSRVNRLINKLANEAQAEIKAMSEAAREEMRRLAIHNNRSLAQRRRWMREKHKETS